MECYFPFANNVVTFRFLAEIPRVFVWKKRDKIKQLHFNVNVLVKLPITFARALPEFDCVLMMMSEELSKVTENKSHLLLKHVQERVKDLFYYINRVCDNNDFRDFLKMGSLNDTISDSKEFGFGAGNIDHMMKHLND